MSTCTIYYPGLLGPGVPLEELDSAEWPIADQTEHLCKLLANSSTKNTKSLDRASIDSRIMASLGISLSEEAELPVAYFRSVNQGMTSQSMWCLDPVHIQIDRDEAVLIANESLALNKDEAFQLIDDINKHFELDGLKVYYHNEYQWLLTGDIAVNTFPLSDVIYRNMNDHQPSGIDAIKWQKIINEVQMLLHEHPVNEKRAHQGLIAVNSLWIWGGGKLAEHNAQIDLVYANESLVADIAKVISVPHERLPAYLDSNHFRDKDTLMVITDQMHAVKQKDVFAWFKYLHLFDKEVLAPLFEFLQQGILNELILNSDTVSITFTKKELKKKFWQILQKKCSLETSIIKLRKQYDH